MKATVITYILVFISQLIFAQGLILEDEAYAQIPQLTTANGLKATDRPKTVDLSDYCPKVRNQGDVYSCVGWAVGYGALTIKKSIKNQWTDKRQITQQAYSAMFIYNQIKTGSCSQGARISDALSFLKTKGDCLASNFDTDVEDCEMKPSPAMLTKLPLDTITDYLSLFAAQANHQQKVNSTIRALARKEPVIVGMSVRKNFYLLQGAKYWWPDLGNTAPAGGHAMVVVGYDLASASFLLFNSWGADWGNKGYIRIKFDDFGAFCKYAFIIQMRQNQLATAVGAKKELFPLKHINASAQFKYLENFTDQNEPVFKNAELHSNGNGEYACKKSQWPIGQLFQLATQASQEGVYLYVFSIDAKQQVNIHWPRSAHLNTKFKGMNESAILIDPNINITIPGKNKALKLSHAGKDAMILLYTNKPIKHPDFIAMKMRSYTGDYRNKLENLLGKHLIPLADVDYDRNQAAFTVSTRSKGYIIPIIITTVTE